MDPAAPQELEGDREVAADARGADPLGRGSFGVAQDAGAVYEERGITLFVRKTTLVELAQMIEDVGRVLRFGLRRPVKALRQLLVGHVRHVHGLRLLTAATADIDDRAALGFPPRRGARAQNPNQLVTRPAWSERRRANRILPETRDWRAFMTTASDVLVDTLCDWGVEVIFGLPGDGI